MIYYPNCQLNSIDAEYLVAAKWYVLVFEISLSHKGICLSIIYYSNFI